jgi:hypothetical protein
MFDAIFNSIINTLIRDLPMATRASIGLTLFTVGLICFTYMFRKKNDLHPIKYGWATLFILCVGMAVLYVTI